MFFLLLMTYFICGLSPNPTKIDVFLNHFDFAILCSLEICIKYKRIWFDCYWIVLFDILKWENKQESYTYIVLDEYGIV